MRLFAVLGRLAPAANVAITIGSVGFAVYKEYRKFKSRKYLLESDRI